MERTSLQMSTHMNGIGFTVEERTCTSPLERGAGPNVRRLEAPV
jgi:hypothetical protein